MAKKIFLKLRDKKTNLNLEEQNKNDLTQFKTLTIYLNLK